VATHVPVAALAAQPELAPDPPRAHVARMSWPEDAFFAQVAAGACNSRKLAVRTYAVKCVCFVLQRIEFAVAAGGELWPRAMRVSVHVMEVLLLLLIMMMPLLVMFLRMMLPRVALRLLPDAACPRLVKQQIPARMLRCMQQRRAPHAIDAQDTPPHFMLMYPMPPLPVRTSTNMSRCATGLAASASSGDAAGEGGLVTARKRNCDCNGQRASAVTWNSKLLTTTNMGRFCLPSTVTSSPLDTLTWRSMTVGGNNTT
jgi:hypothetical protein